MSGCRSATYGQVPVFGTPTRGSLRGGATAGVVPPGGNGLPFPGYVFAVSGCKLCVRTAVCVPCSDVLLWRHVGECVF